MGIGATEYRSMAALEVGNHNGWKRMVRRSVQGDTLQVVRMTSGDGQRRTPAERDSLFARGQS